MYICLKTYLALSWWCAATSWSKSHTIHNTANKIVFKDTYVYIYNHEYPIRCYIRKGPFVQQKIL